MLPNAKRPSHLKARQRSVSRSSSDLPPPHPHPALSPPAAASRGQPIPPPPHNEGPLSQTSPAFASSQSRKVGTRNSSSSVTSLLTSPPIPEIGEKAHDSGIVVEADLDSNYSQYANDDDDDESKKLRQSLLGSPRSQSFQIGSVLCVRAAWEVSARHIQHRHLVFVCCY